MSSHQTRKDLDAPESFAKGSRVARLSLRGIEKSFDTNVVLSGIDLDVYEGELVALLGENGPGKSTMSSIIAGLFPPSKGAMTWEGRPYAPTRPGEAIEAGIGLMVLGLSHRVMVLAPRTITGNLTARPSKQRGDHGASHCLVPGSF